MPDADDELAGGAVVLHVVVGWAIDPMTHAQARWQPDTTARAPRNPSRPAKTLRSYPESRKLGLGRPHGQLRRGRRHGDLRPRRPARSGHRAGRADRRAPSARHDGRVVTGMAAPTVGAAPAADPGLRGPVRSRPGAQPGRAATGLRQLLVQAAKHLLPVTGQTGPGLPHSPAISCGRPDPVPCRH